MNDEYDEEDYERRNSTPNAESGSGSSGQIIEKSPVELSEVDVNDRSKDISIKVNRARKKKKVLVSKSILNEALKRKQTLKEYLKELEAKEDPRFEIIRVGSGVEKRATI